MISRSEKLKLYSFLSEANLLGEPKRSLLIASFTLEEAFVKAKELIMENNWGESRITHIGTVEYDNLVKEVDKKYSTGLMVSPEIKEEVKERERNQEETINFLKIIREKHGDKKISNLINELSSAKL